MKRLIQIFSISFYICTLITLQSFCQLVSDFRVNDDLAGESFGSVVGVDKDGNFTIAWEQETINASNVIAQRFNNKYQKIDTNFRVNNIPDSGNRPAINVSEGGNVIICWSHQGIYCRIYDKNGFTISPVIKVNDSTGGLYRRICVDSDSLGNFVIAWDHLNDLPSKVMFQMFDSLGTKIGNNRKPNETKDETKSPAIVRRVDGSFILTWVDYRESENDIYMQRYDPSGAPIGQNVKVNDTNPQLETFTNPAISADSLGRFVIGYNLYNVAQNETHTKFRRFSPNGNAVGIPVTISFESGIRNISKQKDGSFVVAYNQFAGVHSYPYFKRYDSSGVQIGDASLLTPVALSFGVYYDYVILFQNKIISTMNDSRKGTDDVFSNIRSFENPDSTVNIQTISTEVPLDYKLYQNYPNPFNPQTTIQFENLKLGHIKLIIFDMLGRKVKTLVDKVLASGNYKIVFNGNELPSGTYLYNLIAEDLTISKIMILNK